MLKGLDKAFINIESKASVAPALLLLIAAAYIFELKNAMGELLFTFNTSIMMILFLIVAILCLSPYRGITLNVPTGFVLLLWIVLFSMALLSGFWSEYPEAVMRRSLLIFTPSILITAMAFMDQKPRETFYRITSFLAWFGFSLALYGLVLRFWGDFILVDRIIINQLKLGPLVLSQNIHEGAPLWRISSLKGNPNSLALVLLVSMWATYVQFAAARMKAFKHFILLSVQILALCFTFSRTGIGAAVLMWFLFYCFSGKKSISRISSTLALACLALLIILILLPLIPQGAISALQNRAEVGLNARERAWLPTLASIMDKPLGGVGFAVIDEAVLLPLQWRKGAHNVHLTVLSEIGLPGYAIFLLLWFYGITPGIYWGLRKTSNCEDRLVLLSSGVLLASLLFHQIFEDSLMRICALHFFWVYLIALVAKYHWEAKNNRGGGAPGAN